MWLGRIFNDRILPRLNLRIGRASKWQQRKLLAASPVARTRILTLASFLIPQRALGQSKIRLGSGNDGGYVCLDDFNRITVALSVGIESNDDWDCSIADKGIVVHQFDHTIDSTPHAHQNFRFQKKRIAPIGTGEPGTATITSVLAEHTNCEPASVILKIDIEGDEWEIFLATARDDLRKFSQIICEFHSFHAIDNDDWYNRALAVLEKLHQDFEVVHVHGNNCAPWIIIGNIPFPAVLEVTYAARLRYKFEPTDEIFPTSLDAPNDPTAPDFFLGRGPIAGPR